MKSDYGPQKQGLPGLAKIEKHRRLVICPMRSIMKIVFTILCSTVLAVLAAGQQPVQAAGRALIKGVVTKDPTGEPVKKVLVELIAENQNEGGDYTATTGTDGVFRIEDVLPGRYRLFAERPGFLDVDKHHARSEGRVLTLRAGQELTDLQVRLQAAAVLRGRVTDEDGDPMVGAEVSVIRQTFVSAHRHWEQVGSERTNDLGEYRIANLPAGNVYVSVNPPPDFRSLIESSGAAANAQKKAAADNAPAMVYQTDYYPGTPDRSQAMPIELHAGDDFPANFSLTLSPSVSIRGQVVNLPPRSTATIMLQSRDFRLVTSGMEIDKDGTFVIRNVSPGSYTLLASVEGATVPMMARQDLDLGSRNVDGLRLALQPGALVRGRLHAEGNGKRFDPEQMYLVLQSMEGDDEVTIAGARFSNLAHIGANGEFAWTDVPSETYFVQIAGNNTAEQDWFVKTVQAGGRDLSDSGFGVSGGTVFLDVVVSANGAFVDGVVADPQNKPVSNAVVVAVPEIRMRGRVDHYRQTVTDQTGHFALRGLRPGSYTLFAWESVEGQAYYDPEFLKSYEGQGSALRVNEGERRSVQLSVIPVRDQ